MDSSTENSSTSTRSEDTAETEEANNIENVGRELEHQLADQAGKTKLYICVIFLNRSFKIAHVG